jgi:hypothetical protein
VLGAGEVKLAPNVLRVQMGRIDRVRAKPHAVNGGGRGNAIGKGGSRGKGEGSAHAVAHAAGRAIPRRSVCRCEGKQSGGVLAGHVV